MTPIPTMKTDITYSNMGMLQKMPGCSKLKLGWTNNSLGTYLVTLCPDGIKARCQHWELPEAQLTIEHSLKGL